MYTLLRFPTDQSPEAILNLFVVRFSKVIEVVVSPGPHPVEGSDGNQSEKQRHQDVQSSNRSHVVRLEKVFWVGNKKKNNPSFDQWEVWFCAQWQYTYICGKERRYDNVGLGTVKLGNWKVWAHGEQNGNHKSAVDGVLFLPTGAIKADFKHLNPIRTAEAPKKAARENFLVKKKHGIFIIDSCLQHSLIHSRRALSQFQSLKIRGSTNLM